MKTKTFNEIYDSFSILTEQLKNADADASAISHLCKVDPSLKEMIDYMKDLLGVSENTIPECKCKEISKRKPYIHSNTEIESTIIEFIKQNKACIKDIDDAYTKFVENHLTKTNKKHFCQIVARTFPEFSISEPSNTLEFGKHPKVDIRVTADGKHAMGLVDGEWKDLIIAMKSGYKYVSYNHSARPMAWLVLETFKPHPKYPIGSKSINPVYKDGDRRNCDINNLEWALRNTKIFTYQIEETCAIIAQHPDLTKNAILNLMYGKGVSASAFNKIMKGKYLDISSKYFNIVDGKVIPVVKTNETGNAKPVTESDLNGQYISIVNENKGDIISLFLLTHDIEYASKLFKAKLLRSSFEITKDDLVIPVLKYVKDSNGCISRSENILKLIKDEYGILAIDSKFINAVKTKTIRKDLCDLVI